MIFKPILNHDELYAVLEAIFSKLQRWRQGLEELTRRRLQTELNLSSSLDGGVERLTSPRCPYDDQFASK